MLTLFEQYGLIVVIGNVLLERIGLPIPAFPTLIVVGTLAAHRLGLLSELLCVASVSCLAAESAWYLAGRTNGARIMKLLCRVSLNPDSCVNQTQVRFERWGPKVLLIAKFVPGLSLFAPPLAGATRMPWSRFVLYSAAGDLLWAAAGLGAGVWLGPQLLQLLPRARHIGTYVGSLLAGAALVYIAYKWFQRRRFFATLRMARIGVDELYRLIASGAVPSILDVRSSVARTLDPRRIPGAVYIPLEEVEPRLKDLPRDRETIVYCSCPNEASAARVAKLLMRHGFHQVRPLQGGLDAWFAAGYDSDLSDGAVNTVT